MATFRQAAFLLTLSLLARSAQTEYLNEREGMLTWLSQDVRPDQPAECTNTTTNWTFNQKGVPPCDLAVSIDHLCFPNETAYPFLLNLTDPSSNSYGGPSTSFSNKCDCSTVQYALLSACAFCQNGMIGLWGEWSSDCAPADISITRFPLGFNGTDIPIWAFVNVTEDNQWLPSKGKLLAGTASDLTTNPTTSTTSSTVKLSPTTTSSSPVHTTETTSSAFEGRKSHKGAIAGGVCGAIAGLVLLGVIY
ncbi:hypothetical protein M422DRAFT_261771 [Sphaerobolus stellatus SS14]|uniref:Uncharacterized protein n=1 Tax=Sphaerobolus stellatus (strain SS14) TaxID=990650 RepID=A0A0C9TZH7_SPHS4|nr:hypothetical protein M422DRAFT_261771 [Sphaerobolus stellatus SS14]